MADDYLGLKANEPVARIAEAFAKIQGAERGTLKYAREIGKLLREQKKKVGHKYWTSWVADHCPFSKRTASDYMRISKQWGDIEDAADAKGQHAADLTIREALDLLAPKEKEPLTKEQKNERKIEALAKAMTETEVTIVKEALSKLPEDRMKSFRDFINKYLEATQTAPAIPFSKVG
jgi:hypothetical protein